MLLPKQGVGCARSLRSLRLPTVAEPTSRIYGNPALAERLKPLSLTSEALAKNGYPPGLNNTKRIAL